MHNWYEYSSIDIYCGEHIWSPIFMSICSCSRVALNYLFGLLHILNIINFYSVVWLQICPYRITIPLRKNIVMTGLEKMRIVILGSGAICGFLKRCLVILRVWSFFGLITFIFYTIHILLFVYTYSIVPTYFYLDTKVTCK